MSLHPHGVLASACTAVLALALAACGGDGDGNGNGGTAGTSTAPSVASSVSFAPGTTMARLATARKVVVGTKFDQPGFGEQQLDGKPAGFDVEISKIIAAKLGIPADAITYKEAKSAVREEMIERSDVDFVTATYTINNKRKQRVSFAGPYYVAGQQIMVKSDDNTITGPDSLRTNASAKVCSVSGSTPAENIKKYLATPAQLVTFDVYGKCADALRTGQVSAVTTDNVILLGLVDKSNGAFKMVGKTFTAEPYGIGIKKGDVAFCKFINNTLKEAANSGAYEAAWTSTAGKVEGAVTPQLPSTDACS
jgi:glutamate transport system substrate-binding protein